MANNRIRLVWNNPAFEQLRRDPTTDELLFEHAKKLAIECGEGYLAVKGVGRTRDRAAVITVTGEAIRDNAENNTLLRKSSGG